MRDITLFQTPESSMETRGRRYVHVLRARSLAAQRIARVAQSQRSLLRFFLLGFTLKRIKHIVLQERFCSLRCLQERLVYSPTEGNKTAHVLHYTKHLCNSSFSDLLHRLQEK